MSKNITTIEKSAIEYLCGLIRELSNVSEGIDDINLRSDGTFSSVKIDTLLNNLETDCNEYTDRLVANLSRLELKIVTNEADINKSNILYLHKPDGATSYNQYVVIEGNKVLLGTTDISMTDYYTITQADAKFCLLTDYNSLKTAYEAHKNDTDIHITSDERTKWDKTSTDLTTHKDDTDIHTSATEKASYIKKTDIVTTIDGTVTDEQIASARAILRSKSAVRIDESINPENYEVGEWFAEGNGSTFLSTSYGHPCSEWHIGYIVTGYETSDSTGYKIILAITMSGNCYVKVQQWNKWTKWINIGTTSVADIPVTNISMSSTYTSNVNCKYQVVNGVCYIDFMSGTYKLTSNVNGVILATGLPIPRSGQVCTTYVPWSCADASKQVILFVNGNGELILHASVNANATPVFCTFSYPVK